MSVALAAVDVMAAPDVTDVVGAYMTVVADTGAVAITISDVVIESQAQPTSDPKTALNKTPLTAQSQAF